MNEAKRTSKKTREVLMATVTTRPSPSWSLAELRRHFGLIPGERILLQPPPGTATEQDVIRMNERGDRLCELVDGVLVGKTMGAKESLLAGVLIQWLNNFLDQHDLGIVLGADGMLRLVPGLILVPDVSFISWDRLPEDKIPNVPNLAPDLAVEVISRGNTKKEIDRKLRKYFKHGTRLAWVVYPKIRTVKVHVSRTQFKELGTKDKLDGGNVLPGFSLPIAKLFTSRRGDR